MPLCLAELPIEVLANISSALEAQDILETLPLIGNAQLSSKLSRGGVLSLHLDASKLARGALCARHISVVHSLQLRSLTLSGADNWPPHLASLLIRGLQPTLRSLTGCPCDVLAPDQTLEQNPVPPLSFTSRSIWKVGSTFSELEELHISGSASNLLPDPVSTMRFLVSLPSSLTSLQLPSGLPVFNFWHLLPPSLTILGVASALPPSLPGLPPLVRLDLSTGKSEYELGLPKDSPWSPILDPKSSAFPPNVTHLVIESLQLSQIPHHTFPSTLTRLSFTTGWNSPDSILHAMMVLPVSLTSLHLECGATSMEQGKLPVFHKLKRAALTFNVINPSEESQLYCAILEAMPNVEDMFFSAITRSRRLVPFLPYNHGLGIEHISRLNARCLRKLTGCFRASCFTQAADGSYPLDPFTELRELTILSRQSPYKHFTFAAIPASLTNLNISTRHVFSTTLHLLPPSVTCLRGSLSVDPQDFFGPLFVHPPNPRNEAADASMQLSDVTSFDRNAIRYNMCRFSADGEAIKSGVRLEASKDESGVLLYLTDYPKLPTSIQYLRLASDHYDILGSAKFPTLTDEAFPLLRHLHLGDLRFPPIDLDTLPKLQSLHMTWDPIRIIGRFPPSLKSLEGKNINLSPSMCPLPTSLTEIKCESFGPFTELASLTNLKTFECGKTYFQHPSPDELPPLLACLPAQLTRLELPGRTWIYANLVDQLSDSLKALETIVLGVQDFPISALNHLYHAFAPSVSFQAGTLNIVGRPEVVAGITGLAHGSIRLQHSKYDSWCLPAMKKTFPRLIGNYRVGLFWNLEDEDAGTDYDGYSGIENQTEKSSSWSLFAPYIHVDQDILDLSLFQSDLPQDFEALLPRGLKTLIVSDTFSLPLRQASLLPRSLTWLSLPVMTMETRYLENLPRSLTYFRVGLLELSEGTPIWPPGLTDLEFRTNNVDMLKVLPSTLVKLNITGAHLDLSNLELLHINLKYIEAYDNEWPDEMWEFLQARGMTRLMYKNDWPLTQSFQHSLMLDQALELCLKNKR